jgi:hypothetical protein
MKARPVKRYRQPAYPTRLEVLSEPELLERHLPCGWRALPEMAGTVALFLAVNSTVQAADKKPAAPLGSLAVVAPIFEHGDGRGSTGCIVVAPPVFLSEEEAWQVINEELGRQKLKLPDIGFEVRGVKIPHRTESYSVKRDQWTSKVEDLPGTKQAYKADRANPEKRIAVEFVSCHDYERLGGPGSSSTVQSYDFKQVGRSVAEAVRKEAREKLYFGALYDPAVRVEPPRREPAKIKTAADWGKYWEESLQKSKAESQRLLRLQVQDFLKWLQAQGAI